MPGRKSQLLTFAMLAALLVPAGGLWAQADPNLAPATDIEDTSGQAPAPGAPTATGDGNAVADPNNDGGGGNGGWFGNQTFLLLIVGVFVIVMIMSSRSRKKQQQQRKEMLSSLSKGDKIITIGGIVGTVIESRENEIVVKVDEQNNIRMRFAKWAIRAAGEDVKTTPTPEETR